MYAPIPRIAVERMSTKKRIAAYSRVIFVEMRM